MVSVQADGCAPIVRAFEAGHDRAEPVVGAHTIADGLRVPAAIGDFLMLRILRESGGTALSVDDEAMVEGMRRLGRLEGVSAAPEGGAALAALDRLIADGTIAADDLVVLFNTGGALKYLDVFSGVTDPQSPERHANRAGGLDHVEAAGRHGLRLPDDVLERHGRDVGRVEGHHPIGLAALQQLHGFAAEARGEDAIEAVGDPPRCR